MSAFTDKVRTYLENQRLGRLATIGPDGAPQNRKYRNISADPRVAFVVDDLASITPWSPRGGGRPGRPAADRRR